jgi:sulfate adenylyltransferase large subunit
MKEENLKLVIVGHVDHGKSTLIGRLLFDTDSLPEGKIDEIKAICESLGKELEFGYVMDNLEEERDQGITIDTAQIFFRTPKREYTIIDAPGHVEFVKNMITGASQAEAAILIVDADEGVQEQTRRHAYILNMLGLEQIIVVMNKMDLVAYSKERFDTVVSDLKKVLDNLNITPHHIIPISAAKGDSVAKHGDNMGWYDGSTLLQALDDFRTAEADYSKPLRFSVQDVYKYDKRIIAGRVESGVLKKSEKVVVLPSGEETEVSSIEEYLKEDVLEAVAGKSTGLVTQDKLFIDRGDVISDTFDKPTVTNHFKAHIFWMDKEPITEGERIILKCATQEAICSVEFLRILNSSTLELVTDRKELRNREVADVMVKTEKPIVVENFNSVPELGRFVLERMNTCAGGIITKV